MFTLDQIKAAHSKVQSGADFPRYIYDLRQLGITGYRNHVADGRIDYRGEGAFVLTSPARYSNLSVSETGDKAALGSSLRVHQQGGSDYLTFCTEAAAAGVESWMVDITGMTCTYYDTCGATMMEESIPQPEQE